MSQKPASQPQKFEEARITSNEQGLAVAFALRLLRLANNGASENEIQPFSELAKLVGQTKEPYNDQR